MKRSFYTLTCAAVLVSSAMADFSRVEMGAGIWSQSPKGNATYTDGEQTVTMFLAKKRRVRLMFGRLSSIISLFCQI